MPIKSFKVNHIYLVSFTFIFTFATTVQSGFMLNELSMVNFVVGSKLGWEEDGTAEVRYILIITTGFLGMALGSAMADKLINWWGTRNIAHLVYLLNTFAICSSLLKLVLDFTCILFGRLFFGLACGALNTVLGKILNDSIPN